MSNDTIAEKSREPLTEVEQARLDLLIKEHRNKRADEQANYVITNLFQQHRGCMHSDRIGEIVLYGNDGFKTENRIKRLVCLLSSQIKEDFGFKISGFGLDRDSYTWVLLVEGCDDLKVLETALSAMREVLTNDE